MSVVIPVYFKEKLKITAIAYVRSFAIQPVQTELKKKKSAGIPKRKGIVSVFLGDGSCAKSGKTLTACNGKVDYTLLSESPKFKAR
jgi:hypothetical protein